MTSQWFAVARFPMAVDLLPLLKYIRQQGITTRVTEEVGDEGEQQLWISQAERSDSVREWSRQWLNGQLDIPADANAHNRDRIDQAKRSSEQVLLAVVRFPVTCLLIILGVIGAISVEFSSTYSLAYWLLFQDVQNNQFISLSETLANHHYWRLLTPMFLHFGWAHILFNALILWQFGRRIEWAKGSLHLLIVVVLGSLFANIAQYFLSPNTPFGGLSGVNYTLIGYIALYQHFIPHSVLQFNKAVIAFLIAWLVLGLSGIVDFFIAGGVANGTHVAGLLSGVVMAAFVLRKDIKAGYKNR